MTILLVIINTLLTLIMIPYIAKMLKRGNFIAKNYREESIPIGLGITIVPIILINYLFFAVSQRDMLDKPLIFLTAIITMAFIGIIDDCSSNQVAKGFKGHIYCLLHGELTTGLFKAFIGGMIALFVSILVSTSIIELFLNFFLITLFTNLINLFDLRPGRAIKAYISIALLFIVLGLNSFYKLILYSILGYCLGYLPQDLKAKSMMGDAGSNPLGISLGIISVFNFSLSVKFILVFILLLFHILSEKYSFTKIIRNNAILNYIDQLGRH
ncbi:UDP-N-acetylmuramyl pentapeptide phosphotransferase/UDP-N-acetylglucosamine-1-phosphate transferase [Natronincola peptidivorans]|uniref:UDP-N-acetylmuramyl pentapeptide phosphotransferase/UDP-N-acetylglucosamine-1-phosphate transferase n=1 Tax=Natronincola peptidivorans TaxID=426128 RepID=A0A1H9YN28_9FIRM|nr:glycosyltransferase [Natronincola peptidivorans]SES70459.1 UDP-N-acetylmuramyl pentapeptide phosphotransferase/UDP-N-acetylglucosamine-1-phosphate transferase [Natronincola peptidivorans]